MTFEIISTRRLIKEIYIKIPKDIYVIVKKYAKSRREQFIVITLNTSHRIIGVYIMSIGIVDKTIVHPREVFYYAIKDNASALVFAHNHSSDYLEPSSEDKEITNRLVDASRIMGFHIIDHIIFNKKEFYSMRENGFCFYN